MFSDSTVFKVNMFYLCNYPVINPLVLHSIFGVDNWAKIKFKNKIKFSALNLPLSCFYSLTYTPPVDKYKMF